MNFATKTDLLPHQVPAVAKLLPSRIGAAFMDMGTGKTRTALELAKLRGRKWDRVFWFCPCSCKETIRQQILLHTDIPAAQIKVWDDKVASNNLPAEPVQIIGIETMSASDRAVMAYAAMVTDRSFVVVDESDLIKGHDAARTQRITFMSERARYRMVLTGTPMTQGPVDLYAQMRFLSPKILGYKSFYSFAANHLEYETRKDAYGRKIKTGRIVRCHNVEWLAARIAPYTYQVEKDECLDLPEKLYTTRHCSMTSAQRELYESAKAEMLPELERDDFSPIQIFRLFTALQTITCGFWNRRGTGDDPGRTITVGHHRIELLLSTVAEIPADEKIVIWSKYHHCVDEITRALSAEFGRWSIAHLHGEIDERKRNAELDRWRRSARFLVATEAGGRGLTLIEASYAIFYADGFKYSMRRQQEDRIHRIGQTRRPVYASLRCEQSIDGRIADALDRKGNVLAEFQAMVNQCRSSGLRKRIENMVMAL